MIDKFILFFSNELSSILNPGIIGLSIYELIIMIKLIDTLKCSLKRIKELTAEDRKTKKAIKKGKIVKKELLEMSYMNWDDYKNFQVQYKDAEKQYTRFALIIQLFTLLGILGTVAGLFISLSNGEINNDNIYKGVGFALSSTILGIFMAIIFKACDVWITSHYITQIDSYMDIYEKDYNVSRDIADLDKEEY